MEEGRQASWLIDSKLNQIKSICKLRFVMEKYAKFQRLSIKQKAKEKKNRVRERGTAILDNLLLDLKLPPSRWVRQVHS